MRRTAARSTLAVGMVFVATAALAGCSTAAEEPAASGAAAAEGGLDLSANCPANIVIQTDWNPEAEHGHLYQLLGPDPVIDADQKSVSGDLYYEGASTGVTVEVRSGGPAIGFQTPTAQMYGDPDITLAYATTDEAIQLSEQFPTTAVFAPLEINPQMIMWDPETYPDVTDIESLGTELEANGGVLRYFDGAAYMEYLRGDGIVPESIIDGSYDGAPASFVAAGGKDAQQGFASAEPYIYENEITDWAKPVEFQLVHDTGYEVYAASMSVRSDDLEDMSPCLTDLVPVLQQAEVDYFASPDATNALILQLVEEFENGWVYTQGTADYSVATMKELGIVGNGDNDFVGDMDEARIQKIIDIDTPIFEEQGTPPAEGLEASDLFTNEFLDESIGF